MADTTTVKVQTSTRDLLLQIGVSRHHSLASYPTPPKWSPDVSEAPKRFADDSEGQPVWLVGRSARPRRKAPAAGILALQPTRRAIAITWLEAWAGFAGWTSSD